MEEKQIQEFVRRVAQDGMLRNELATDPTAVIARENFSPRVAQIVARLIPQLAFHPSSLVSGVTSSDYWLL